MDRALTAKAGSRTPIPSVSLHVVAVAGCVPCGCANAWLLSVMACACACCCAGGYDCCVVYGTPAVRAAWSCKVMLCGVLAIVTVAPGLCVVVYSGDACARILEAVMVHLRACCGM